MKTLALVLVCLVVCYSLVSARTIAHNGILFSKEDITRAKVGIARQISPYYDTFVALNSSAYANPDRTPQPADVIVRGAASWAPPENYWRLYEDAAAVYQLALMWTVTNESRYGDGAVRILSAWASTLQNITGSADRYLATGIYGYQLAVGAEMLRTFPGFSAKSQSQVGDMLLKKFWVFNKDFITEHVWGNANDDYIWANWDLCNIASGLAIGVFTGRADIYDFALEYLYNGGGRGSFRNVFPHVFSLSQSNNTFGLAEGQESGRDQGHAGLDFALLGVIAQIAYLQGDDIWSYHDNVVLQGAEYFAKYNSGYDVPFATYEAQGNNITEISSASRGNYRPIWSLYYATYVKVRSFDAEFISKYFQSHPVERGGGSYGPNSGGFDQLGFGSIAYLTNEEILDYLD